MSPEQRPDPDFEQRLLARLRAVVAERGAAAAAAEAPGTRAETPSRRRRGARLALGGVAALAAVAIALIVSSGGDGAPAAYAVEPQPGGGVNIKIYSLSDAGGVEEALEEAGIRSQVTYLPAGMTCHEPHYRPSTVALPSGARAFSGFDMGSPGGPLTIGIGDERQWHRLFREMIRSGKSAAAFPNFFLSPESFDADHTLILFGSPAPHDGDPEGGSVSHVRIAEGPVGPCEPVAVADRSAPMRVPFRAPPKDRRGG